VQNLTSYSCSPTPISYKSDDISHISLRHTDRQTDRQRERQQTTDAATETEGSHTVVCEPNNTA